MNGLPDPRDRFTLYRAWGARLRRARLAAELDQTELGRRLGVDQRLVSRWELGRLAPRDPLRPHIAAALGCSIESLFPYQPDEEDVPA